MLSRRLIAVAHPASRRGQVLRVVLASVAVLFVATILACMGIGYVVYVWWQRNLGQALVVDPPTIRKMTTEIADITIPKQFSPYRGSRVFGTVHIEYRWCPQGNCAAAVNWFDDVDVEPGVNNVEWDNVNADGGVDFDFDHQALGKLSLVVSEGDPFIADIPTLDDDEFTDTALEAEYESFQREVITRTIRGQECRFYIITGREWKAVGVAWEETVAPVTVSVAPESEETTAPHTDHEPPADATVSLNTVPLDTVPLDSSEPRNAEEPGDAAPVAELAEPVRAGKSASREPTVRVAGRFPGKRGTVQLQFRIEEDEFDAEVIRQLIDSIR